MFASTQSLLCGFPFTRLAHNLVWDDSGLTSSALHLHVPSPVNNVVIQGHVCLASSYLALPELPSPVHLPSNSYPVYMVVLSENLLYSPILVP